MRRISLVFSLMGILILLLFLSFIKPLEINSKNDLWDLKQNQRVLITGKVISENIGESYTSIKLNNSLELSCASCPSFINKTIIAIGYINIYNHKKNIELLRIKAVS